MKNVIKEVLEVLSYTGVSIDTEPGRQLITDTIIKQIKKQGLYLNLDTRDGKQKKDSSSERAN